MHGHDVHFLERLERLTTVEVELALELYRDPLLVQHLLQHFRIPDDAPRVALALGDSVRGPFLLVARDGHFVTCLAEGMSPEPHPVIARGQLDAAVNRVDTLRDRLDAVRQLSGRRRGAFGLLDRIFVAGPWLSREELMAIAAFQPLLKKEFFDLLWATDSIVDMTRAEALRCARRPSKYADELRTWWNRSWAIGHLSLLATMDSRDVIEELPAGSEAAGVLSWPAVRQGVVATALRGIWGVAKLGKPLLADYKAWYVKGESTLEVLDAALGLLAMGLRHRKLEAEVRKALARRNRSTDPAMQRTQSLIAEVTDRVFDEPEKCDLVHVSMGRAHASRKAEDGEPLPDDVARLLAATSHATFLGSKVGLVELLACLPWVARAAPEDMYWPLEWIERNRPAFDPEDVARMLRDVEVASPKPVPVQAAQIPGRNEPCSCGSGQKYKRCHGMIPEPLPGHR